MKCRVLRQLGFTFLCFVATANAQIARLDGSLSWLEGGHFGATHGFRGEAGQIFSYRLKLPRAGADWYVLLVDETTTEVVLEAYTMDSEIYSATGKLPSSGMYTLTLVADSFRGYSSTLALTPSQSRQAQYLDYHDDVRKPEYTWVAGSLGADYRMPDVAALTAVVEGGNLTLEVTYYPDTFDPKRNEVSIFVDADGDASTGFKGQEGFVPPGADYRIHFGALDYSHEVRITPLKTEGAAATVTGSVELLPDGFRVVVPINVLGGDPNHFGFYLYSDVALSEHSSTTILDVIPSVSGWLRMADAEMPLPEIQSNDLLAWDLTKVKPWDLKDGSDCKFDYQSGLLIRTKQNHACEAWTNEQYSPDISIETSATVTSAPEPVSYGLAFARQQNGDLLLFMLSTDGTYSFLQRAASKWSILIPRTLTDAMHQGLNLANVLTVELRGRAVSLFVNGSKIADYELDRLPIGSMEVYSDGLGVDQQGDVVFSRLMVSKLM
jgi:hypothetical protein